MEKMSALEAVVLGALAQLGKPAHAGALSSEVSMRLGNPVNRGALARGLASLAQRGYAIASRGRHSPHGGPSRVLYELTEPGRERLADEVRRLHRMMRVRRLSPLARAFLIDPPRGSKVAEAQQYGIDLVLLSHAVLQSPAERYREVVEAMGVFQRYAQ